MPYEARLVDSSGYPLPAAVHRESTVQVGLRAGNKTTGADALGNLRVMTHVEGDNASDTLTAAIALLLAGQSNGTTVEAVRGNTQGTLLASAARTATTASADQINHSACGVRVAVNITVWTAGSLTVQVQEKDPVSGTYRTILSSAALAATGLTVLVVYPGVTVTANLAASEPLPRTWRVNVVHADATSITYSCGFSLIV